MNRQFVDNNRPARWLQRLRTIGISMLVSSFLVVCAQAAVPVDQQPLVIKKPQASNIVLMLDDSGSMGWDFMPDYYFINNNWNNDAWIDSSNNGVYYNPNVLYVPPPRADGTYYPNANGLTSAWSDGFHGTGVQDLTLYTGWIYSYSVQKSVPSAGGTSVTKTYNNFSNSDCKDEVHNLIDYGYNVISWTYQAGVCSITYQTSGSYRTVGFFQYSTGPAAGPYTVYYVTANAADCQYAPAPTRCVGQSDTSGASAPAGVAVGQNIANWFAYYHTRILMAKSGLMEAFSGINPDFRIGFGSINGRNNGALPSPTASYNGRTIAEVQKFGDGTAGTQKAAFWRWLVGVYPSGGTPLRVSLDAVGKYYQSAQPWQTSSTDQTELACRQSYTILTTDGFWNGWSPGVGNTDGANGSTIKGVNGQSYTYTAAAPYADNQSDTLADVAMYYWMNDLRTNVANEVVPNAEDPAFWQHMTTFTMGLGFTPQNISPSGTTIDQIFNWARGGTPISGFSWPVPTWNSINNIADLAHAGVDGHGGFYSAKNPQAFASGIRDALKRAGERIGTGASLAANSTQLKTGTVAYQANYYTVKWKGDLKAFSIDPVTGKISTTPTWQATKALPLPGLRNIYTYNPTAVSSTKQFVPFNDPKNLSAAEKAALGTTTTDQTNVIDYLRGSATMEERNGGIFRNRDTPLGDIVNSQPVYVGAPDTNQFVGATFTGSASYPSFASAQASRSGEIYVAANDGMLHGFDSSTGTETFAYMPAAVITSGIKDLSNPYYGTFSVPHQFFNDGELTVADVYYTGSWHTVLVGTTGRGPAMAVYALDVTDPTNIKFLWERSAGDGLPNSGYIGQMVGKPVIAQTGNGNWSVLIGNGYNSAKNTAALLQFDIQTGLLTVHTTALPTTNNGLAAPAIWIDNPNNGISTQAYAGDLDGNVWSFTLSSAGVPVPTSVGTLVFTAKDAGGTPQPITAGMLAGKDSNTGNVWLFFGTGRYLSTSDLLNTSTQTWYGIIVQSPVTSLVSSLSAGRSALIQRYIIAQTAGNPTANPPVLPARVVTSRPATSDMTRKAGWYMDLQTPVASGSSTSYINEGERMVTPSQFQGSLLLGTTRIPQATDLCNPSGSGWIMAIDPFTGTNPAQNFYDVNNDGSINGGDSVTVGGKQMPAAGVGFTSLPNNPIFVGAAMLVSFDNGSTSSLMTSGTSGGVGRVSWRELTTQ